MRSCRWVRSGLATAAILVLSGCATSRRAAEVSRAATALPAMAWDHRPEAAQWTRATLAAIRSDGAVLLDIVPGDIARWCPAYPRAGSRQRAAFWAGLLSVLAGHESTWRPEAEGGGGRWIGLTQIDPRTARAFGCRATTKAELKDGAANLACAVRIASAQVERDAQVAGGPGAWRGLARDWAPFRSLTKRAEMTAWTSAQDYCRK